MKRKSCCFRASNTGEGIFQWLLTVIGSVSQAVSAQNEMDALLQNILTSSAIGVEQLNVGLGRSSLARRMGLEPMKDSQGSRRSEGVAE